MTKANATIIGNAYELPRSQHLIEIEKADSALTIEIAPDEADINLVMLLDYDRIPTYKKYQFGVMVNDEAEHTGALDRNQEGQFFIWRVAADMIQNRTGRWFLTVLNLTEPVDQHILEASKPFDRRIVAEFHSDFSLRTWTTGCYYFNEQTQAWIADGMAVSTTYKH